MASISKISDKATKINFSGNVLYYFAFGTIIVSGEDMQIKFFNGVEQRFKFSDFTTVETDFESFIDSLIVLDYFRVPTSGSAGGGGGDATAANQTTQISLATSTNTKLDSLIANNATAANQVAANVKLDDIIAAITGNSTGTEGYERNNTLDKILTELKENNRLLRKILN